jgi:hypothetical protein
MSRVQRRAETASDLIQALVKGLTSLTQSHGPRQAAGGCGAIVDGEAGKPCMKDGGFQDLSFMERDAEVDMELEVCNVSRANSCLMTLSAKETGVICANYNIEIGIKLHTINIMHRRVAIQGVSICRWCISHPNVSVTFWSNLGASKVPSNPVTETARCGRSTSANKGWLSKQRVRRRCRLCHASHGPCQTRGSGRRG